MRVVWQCEADAYRREVLRLRFPGVPVYEDVREINAAASVDLLCGGFPCQDLSVAGRRAGLAGNRSGLFFEFARIAGALRPRWLLVENVCGAFSSNGGRDFGCVLGTLADLGYGVAWRVLDSRFFGVPQRRRRVFIVGVLADGDPRAAAERAGQVLAVGTRCPRHPAARGEAGPDVAGALAGRSASRLDDACAGGGQLVAETLTSGGHPNSNMPGRRKEDDMNLVAAGFHMTQDPIDEPDGTPTLGRTSGGMGVVVGTLREHVRPGSNTDHTVVRGATVRRLTPRECERLQGFPDDWTTGPDSRRYAALGDAVTVNVAEWIGRRIMAVEAAPSG